MGVSFAPNAQPGPRAMGGAAARARSRRVGRSGQSAGGSLCPPHPDRRHRQSAVAAGRCYCTVSRRSRPRQDRRQHGMAQHGDRVSSRQLRDATIQRPGAAECSSAHTWVGTLLGVALRLRLSPPSPSYGERPFRSHDGGRAVGGAQSPTKHRQQRGCERLMLSTQNFHGLSFKLRALSDARHLCGDHAVSMQCDGPCGYPGPYAWTIACEWKEHDTACHN